MSLAHRLLVLPLTMPVNNRGGFALALLAALGLLLLHPAVTDAGWSRPSAPKVRAKVRGAQGAHARSSGKRPCARLTRGATVAALISSVLFAFGCGDGNTPRPATEFRIEPGQHVTVPPSDATEYYGSGKKKVGDNTVRWKVEGNSGSISSSGGESTSAGSSAGPEGVRVWTRP